MLVALEQALGGVDGTGQHEHRVDADQAGVDDAGHRGEPEGLGLVAGHHQHRAGAVGDLRGAAGGVHAVFAGHGLEAGQPLEGGLAQALVALDAVGGARRLAVVVEVGRVDAHQLGAEAVLGPGLGGQLLGAQAEVVGVGPGDAPLVGDALGTLELGGELVLAEVALGDGPADVERLGRGRAHGHLAQILDAAGHGDVDDARADQAGRQVGGLLRRAALGVDGGGRRAQGQAGGEPGRAGDVEGLHAHLAHAAADHLARPRRGRRRCARSGPAATVASRSAEWMVDRPPLRRPMGVRTASTMTTSRSLMTGA